jgi:nucleoside-diphosphate-sugar epimerase
MTTVGVTAPATALGAAVLERLDADPGVSRVVGLGLIEPQMPVAKLDFRPVDLRDPLLARMLEGIEVLIHLEFTTPRRHGDATAFAANVHGARSLLAAAETIGLGQLVVVSSARVYGAHPDNPVPLSEETPRRASPDDPEAYQRLLVEELVEDWAAAHPGTPTSVLRPATLLGPGAASAATRYLQTPRLPVVAGSEPPGQFLHVDDAAAAVTHALREKLAGAYNVAADGWLSLSELCGVLGKRTVAVPEAPALAVTGELWRRGMARWSPAAMRSLMYPCVLSAERLRAAGWQPRRPNREILREFTTTHGGYVCLGPVRVRRRRGRLGVALGLASSAGTAAAGAAWRRRRPTARP